MLAASVLLAGGILFIILRISESLTTETRRIDCLSTQYTTLRLASALVIVLFVFGVPFFWLVSPQLG